MLLVLVLRNPVTELYMSSSRSKELGVDEEALLWKREQMCSVYLTFHTHGKSRD